MAKIFFILVNTLILSGCASGLSTARLASTNHESPVFILSGGFTSCETPWDGPEETNLFVRAQAVMRLAAFASGLSKVAFVATCFVTDKDHLRVQTDADSAPRAIARMDLTDVVLSRLEDAGPDARPVLIGHSWGGWLALKLAHELALTAPPRYLATIDPVSPELCSPKSFLGGFFESGRTRPCDQGPADLAAILPAIAAQTGQWQHFYQDRFHYLRSPPLAAAASNTRVGIDLPPLKAWQAHELIARSETVWSAVGTALNLTFPRS